MSQRNDAEQQQAEQLEALISAVQHGQTPTLPDETARFAARLTQTAGSLQPDPIFARRLEARLLAQARQTNQTHKTTLPFWETFLRSFEMKRVAYSLAGIAVLAVIVLAAWNLLRPGGDETGQPVAVVSATPASVAAAATPTPAPAVQPGLPAATEAAIKVAPGGLPVRGLGGGGGDAAAYYAGPFENATLSLETSLPPDTISPIYRAPQNNTAAVDLAALQAFATQMGVNGPLYYEWSQGLPVRAQEATPGQIYSYRIFDGARRVSVYGGSDMVYEDVTLLNFSLQNPTPLPFEQRQALAERFLQERGQLDFTYTVRASYGFDVQFVALQDGRPVNNWPVYTVTVTGDGQIASVYRRNLSGLEQVGDGELISAEAAWNYLQAHLNDGQISYNIYPSNPAYYSGGQTGQTTHWERAFEPGQDVTVYAWPQVFRPVNDEGSPYIITERNMVLTGDAATLEAIANSAGQNVRLQGQIGGEPGRLTLNVTAWETQSGPFDLYLNGTVRQADGQTYLEIAGGFRFLLNNAPADLPTDQPISVYSWGARAADGNACQAIIDWLTIDLTTPGINPAAVDPVASDPYAGITNVSINSVNLAYHYAYPGEVTFPATQAYSQSDANLLPVWYFQGVTNKGDGIEFFLPALNSLGVPLP